MTKNTIIKQLKIGRNAPFMSLNDVAKALRLGKEKTKTVLLDCDYLELGNSRRYLVDDVADAVLSYRKR